MQKSNLPKCLSVDAKAEEFNLAKLAGVILQLLRLSPLLEGDLDVVIRLDGNEVSILVTVPQPHRASGNGVVRKSSNLSIDPINQGLVSDVERDNQGNIVTIAVNLDFQLRGQSHIAVSGH